MTADIHNGIQGKNAIKFKEWGIRVNFQNSSVQQAFDGDLKTYFDFKMFMAPAIYGYYRCDRTLYRLPADDYAVVRYSLRCGNHRTCQANNIYSKLNSNTYYFSPYATWRVRYYDGSIDERTSTKLTKYSEDTIESVQLIGLGQYIRNETAALGVCNEQLSSFYELVNNSK